MAESTGIEPVRPKGLDALAPRCLTARPTLQIQMVIPAGIKPVPVRKGGARSFQLSYGRLSCTGAGKDHRVEGHHMRTSIRRDRIILGSIDE